MKNLFIISMILFALGGCTSSNEVDKDARQEKTENIDLVIDGLDDLIEDSEEINTGS